MLIKKKIICNNVNKKENNISTNQINDVINHFLF